MKRNLDDEFSSNKRQETETDALRRQADNGNIEAMMVLATRYYLGNHGVIQDFGQALELSMKAAVKGHGKAMFRVGMSYIHAKGVAQDLTKAAYWFDQAARKGQPNAMFNLGIMYYEGKGVPKDLVLAKRLIGAAVDKGISSHKARIWLRRAAENGDKEAMFNLGRMYYEGKGGAQDLREAVAWFKKASGSVGGEAWFGRDGDMKLEAKMELTKCLAFGRGCNRDARKARQLVSQIGADLEATYSASL